MIDINSILTQALAAAVAEATKPLVERIAALETRLLALENNPAQGVDATLETRLLALEKHTAVLDQHGGILEYLDNQEWFWEKVAHYVYEAVARHEDDAPHIGHSFIDQKIEAAIEAAIDAHLEHASHYDEDDVGSWIDNAIENHEGNRTHGDEDDIEEIVQKLLNSASISIGV